MRHPCPVCILRRAIRGCPSWVAAISTDPVPPLGRKRARCLDARLPPGAVPGCSRRSPLEAGSGRQRFPPVLPNSQDRIAGHESCERSATEP